MDEDEIRHAAQQALRDLGPVHVEELLERLDDDHEGDLGFGPRELRGLLMEEVADGFAAFPLLDGRICDLEHLVDGLTLSHELDDDERSRGEVAVDPDLSPLHLLSPDGRTLPLADGGHLTIAGEEADRLAGPSDWLPDAPVLLVHVVDGTIEVEGRDELPEPDSVTAERLARTYDAIRGLAPRLLDVPLLLLEARARHPRLLAAPDAPLADLLAAADIPVEEGRLGIEDGEEPLDLLVEHLGEDHAFSPDEVDDVLRVLDSVERITRELRRMLTERAAPASPEELVAEVVGTEAAAEQLTAVLGDTELTLAVSHDVVGSDALAAASLLGLLRGSGLRLRDRSARANLHWLTGRALELSADDHREAEREFRRAHEADDRHVEAIVDLGRYLGDRGQAGAALGLLRLVEGADVDDLKDLLEHYARPGPTAAGRNEPCPCGSGRKHKACCQATGGWPLTERLDWLWTKIVRFATSPVADDLIAPIADAADSEVPGAGAMEDVAVANLVMFEGGLIGELCELRGGLLPADELDLLRQWQEVSAGAYEVVEADPEAPAVTLLDLTSGERSTLADHSMSRSLTAGDAVLAWLVPTPEGLLSSGGVLRIPDQHRGHVRDLLDEGADAVDLARWYASLRASPRLATTEGDPLTFVTRTYRVADPDRARAALATRLDDDGEQLVSMGDGGDGDQVVRGSVTIEDERLVVETMSVSRAAWFARLIEELVPEAELIDEERLPAAEVVGAERAEDGPGRPLDLDAMDPAERADIEAQLEEMMTRHEDAWLDTGIPALDGATPREAADDPTRRPALVRLLDELDEQARNWSSPGRPMDADRLRRLLGL